MSTLQSTISNSSCTFHNCCGLYNRWEQTDGMSRITFFAFLRPINFQDGLCEEQRVYLHERVVGKIDLEVPAYVTDHFRLETDMIWFTVLLIVEEGGSTMVVVENN